MFDLMRQPSEISGDKREGGYALYDVLLTMFCNKWTWVSLKRIQIEKVERTREDYGPVGVWKKERGCALAIILLARGLQLTNHNPKVISLMSLQYLSRPSSACSCRSLLTLFPSRPISSTTNCRDR